jgi:hypothetical protein
MKFPIEKFRKLPQLDRIEYMQRINNVINRWEIPLSAVFFIYTLYALEFLFAFSLAFLGASDYGDAWYYAFINLAKNTLYGVIIYSGFIVIILLIYKYQRDKQLLKLQEEYFLKKK